VVLWWGYFKTGKKACTGLNPKAISGGTGKVVKRVGVWGNLKAKSGGMGKDFRLFIYAFSIWGEYLRIRFTNGHQRSHTDIDTSSR
jgi:hypothetical protein